MQPRTLAVKRDAGEATPAGKLLVFYLRGEKSDFMRPMPCAMGKRDVGSDAPAEDSFLLWLYPDDYLRW